MVVNPNALRNELALEIRRWYPANTWTEALAAADAAIAGMLNGEAATPVEHHPLVIFIANTFIVPWSWAGAAYNTILTGGGPPPLTGFITVWRTTAAAESITIPTTGSGFSCTIDWGDGSPVVPIGAPFTHVYAAAGDHTVTITGTFPRIYLNNGGDKNKVIKILNWGAVGRTGMNGAFRGCINLIEISATDNQNLPSGDWSFAFENCKMPTINLTGHPGGITTLANLFASCTSLVSATVPGLCSATTTGITGVFSACAALTTIIGLNTWVTTNVTSMSLVFNGCVLLPTADVAGWNTAKVTNFGQMFRNIPAMATPNLAGWSSVAATDLSRMFHTGPMQLPSIAHFDVGLVTTCLELFYARTLTTANYDALLIAWAAQSPDLKPAVPFHGGGSKYSAGAATSARAVLTGTHTWAITDGGPAALLVNDEMQGPVEDVSTRVLNVDPLGNGWNVLTGSADVGEGQTVVGPGGVRAVINAGSPNVVITAVVQAFAPVGLMFRSRVGGVRSMRVLLGIGGTLELQRVGNGGVVTVVASVPAMPAADTTEHHLQIWVDAASRIIVYFDGVPLIDVVDAYQMNRPWHGILAGPGAVYLREFSIAEYPV